MKKLHLELIIDAEPGQVWQILGDLAATDRWVPGVSAVRIEGQTRICTLAGGGEIREEITELSPHEMGYRYTHVATPMPVTRSSGRFAISPAGAGATVIVEAELEAQEPPMQAALEQMMEAGLQQALNNLKRLVESASPTPAPPLAG